MYVKISDRLISYFKEYGRVYSWRMARTPYKVYLSEMLLQRTRADQVEPVFKNLILLYPDIISLETNFEFAVTIMKPLGRFCRLDYFKKGLFCLVNDFGGMVPQSKEDLLNIPGIGHYIAAAIRIFGFGIRDVIIDTNVVRVFGRLYGLDVDPETRRNKIFIELVQQHVPEKFFVEYSYGLLDFARDICRPFKPMCSICMLGEFCRLFFEVIQAEKDMHCM